MDLSGVTELIVAALLFFACLISINNSLSHGFIHTAAASASRALCINLYNFYAGVVFNVKILLISIHNKLPLYRKFNNLYK